MCAKSKYKHGNNFHVIKVNSSRIEIMEIRFSLFNSCLCITILLHILYFVKFNMMLFILMSWSCKFMVQWTKKYELFIVDGTRALDIFKKSLWKEFFWKLFHLFLRWGEIYINLKFHHPHSNSIDRSSWTTWISLERFD